MATKMGRMDKQGVIVVSGLPRSGTSMMMQMLAAGGLPVLADDVRGPDLDNPRGYFEFNPVRRTAQDARWLSGAPGKAVKVIHLLLPALPNDYAYRVLFVLRDMRQVLASQEAMLRRLGRRGADLTSRQLAEVFAGQLRLVRKWLAVQSNVAALDVDYQGVIDNPTSQAAQVNQFLGGHLDEARMAAVVDPSLYRQR